MSTEKDLIKEFSGQVSELQMNNKLHDEIIKNPSAVGMLYSEAEDLEKLN
jgi:hypothetical protein